MRRTKKARKLPAHMKKSPRRAAQPKGGSREAAIQRRLWLMYPQKLITNPIIWQLGQRFEVVTNVRQASVTDEIGIVCLELDGPQREINAAIRWLERTGISVEPVEINVLES